MNCSISVTVMVNAVECVLVHSYERDGGSCLVMVAARVLVAHDDLCSIWNIQNIVVIES